MCATANGIYLASAANDKSVKIFDVVNFDMINMLRLDFVPLAMEWAHAPGDAIAALAVSEAETAKIHIYDAQGTNQPLHTLDKFHMKPVNVMRFNVAAETMVSVDKAGILEFWQSPKYDYKFPAKVVKFESKLDTSKGLWSQNFFQL